MGEDVQGMAIRISMEDSSFTQGMQSLKAQLGTIDSGFKSSIAGVKDWGTSLDGLKANATALGEKINIQKQIVEQYQAQLDKSKTSLEKNSQAMMDLKGKVESAKTAWEQSKATLGENDAATLKLKKDYDDLAAKYSSSEKVVLSNSKAVEGNATQLNNATGKLKTMESDLTTVGNKLDEGTKKQGLFAQASQKMGLNMDNLKPAFGAIGLAVGGFLKSAIDSAGEMESSEAALRQTVKSTGDACGLSAKQMEDLAQKEQGVSTFSKDTIVSGEAVLATFTNIGKKVFPEASQAMLDVSQKMGKDLPSTAKALGKALNDPVAGLGALGKMGIQFSSSQKETIKTMVKTGDTAGAQGLIIDELNKKFGGQASAAANTFEGHQKQMSNEFKTMKETIGVALLPVITQLLGSLTKMLVPIIDFISKNPGFTAAVLAIVTVVGILVGGLAILNMATQTFSITLKLSMLPTIGLVILAIAALVFIAFEITKNWGTISKFFIDLWKTVSDAFSSFWTWLKGFFITWYPEILGILTGGLLLIPLLIIQNWGPISAFFVGLWNGIKDFLTSVWTGIETFLTTIWNDIVSVVMGIVNGFVDGITNIFNSMKDGLDLIMQGLSNVFGGIWDVIKNIFLGAILLILDLVTGNFGKLKTDAEGIFNNLSDAFGKIWDGIKQIFTGAGQAISGFLTLLWTGIKNDAISAWNSLKDAVISIVGLLVTGAINTFNGVVNFFRNLPGTLYGLGVSAFNSLKSGITSVMGTIGSAVSSGFDGAISFIRGLPGQMVQWGKDMINGIVSGIKSAAGAVGAAINGVAQDIRKFLHFSVPDEGPLADYESWMPDMMSGLAKGIQKSKGLVTDAITGLGADMNVGIHATAIPSMAAATVSGSMAGNTYGPSITIINQGTIVGSRGMDEFATTVSRKVAQTFGRSVGGSF
jgi:phage-related protein